MNSLRAISLTAASSLRLNLRSASAVVSLFIVIFASSFVGSMIVGMYSHLSQSITSGQLSEVEAQKMLDEAALPVAGFLLSEDRGGPWATYLATDKPLLLTIVIFIFLSCIGSTAALSCANAFSSDIAAKRLRFLLLRVERGHLFIGRFLALTVITWFTLITLLIFASLYMMSAMPHYSAAAYVTYTLRAICVFTVLIPPYTALCTWISSLLGHAAASYATCFGIVIAPPLVGAVSHMLDEKWQWIGHARHLLPSGYAHYGFHPDWYPPILLAVACMALTALFLRLGVWTFTRRDL